MALARLLWRIDADTGDFEAGARRMEESTDRVSQSWDRVAVGVAGVATAITGAIALVEELGQRIEELDLASIQTGIDSTLLGADREAALAVQAVGAPFGVGPEQYFDAAEAVRDALSREGESGQAPRAAARAIGLDIAAYTAPELSAFERSNLLLDTLIASDAEPAALLTAASELGAGDIRDFLSLAGVVEQAPASHPRLVAEQLRAAGAAISDADAQANAEAALARSLDRTVGQEQLSRGFGAANLLQAVTPFDDLIERLEGRRARIGARTGLAAVLSLLAGDTDDDIGDLASGRGTTGLGRRAVTVEISDSTVGGIRATGRIATGIRSGRSVVHEVPAR